MNNLQLFAEGEGDGSGAGNGNEDGAGAGSGDSGNEMSFDDFLGQAENRAEFDRRVQKAVNTAVTKAQEKWQALTDDKLSEAEKLAKMTKEEKAEYKTRKLEKELADLKRQNSLSEMSKTARKMLADEEINIPDEILAHLVSESAEDTKTAVEAFTKMYKDEVQAAVKDALKGNAPKGGSGGKGAVTKEQILDMLDAGQYKELKEELGNMYPVDIAETLEDFEQKPLVMVFRLLAKEEAAETFTYMNSDMREVLIGALTDSELEEVMEEMYLDDTVDVLEEMPANVVDRLLMVTDEETRAQINQLLQYPEDSAGSIMNVEYIALRKEMTVEESILKIRQVGLNRETIYTCYVTEKRKLIGRVDVKELRSEEHTSELQSTLESRMPSSA